MQWDAIMVDMEICTFTVFQIFLNIKNANYIKKIISNDTDDEDIESSQEEISEAKIMDTSTTARSNINYNNKQSHYSSKKRTNAGSHNVSSKKIRHR